MAKIKKAMKGGSKVAGGKKGKKAPESDQVKCPTQHLCWGPEGSSELCDSPHAGWLIKYRSSVADWFSRAAGAPVPGLTLHLSLCERRPLVGTPFPTSATRLTAFRRYFRRSGSSGSRSNA